MIKRYDTLHTQKSMMASHGQDVKNIFEVYQNFLKFCGMSCFCYPCESFKTSIIGLGSAVFYSAMCVLLFTSSLRSFADISKKNLSAVYLVGLTMIEVVVHSSMLVCIWMNVFLRKRIFRALKMFEKFDEVILDEKI